MASADDQVGMKPRIAILDFPDELMRAVFGCVLRTSRSSLATCLRVCKMWKKLGMVILRRDIYLDNPMSLIPLFNAVHGAGRPYNYLTRSFSLNIHYIRVGFENSFIRQSEQWLYMCGKVIKCLSSLKFLSLRCSRMRRADVCNILGDIPPTLTSLELDFGEDNDTYSQIYAEHCSDVDHFCPLLAKLVPQLSHFRICCISLCDQMVPSVEETKLTWRLQGLDIIMLRLNFDPGTEHRAVLIAKGFSRLLRSEINKACFTRTAIVQSVSNDLSHQHYRATDYSTYGCFPVLNTRELVKSTNLSVPVQKIDCRNARCRFFTRVMSSETENGHRDLYANDFRDLASTVAPDTWVEDSELGLRFPRAFASSNEGKNGDFTWTTKIPKVITLASDWWTSPMLRWKLYKAEELAGRTLL